MEGKINLAIFSARNLRTSTGCNNTVLNLLDNLDPITYRISLVLIDDLVPKELFISEEQLVKDPTHTPFTAIQDHSNLFHIYQLSALTLKDLRSLFDVAIVAIYNNFGEEGQLLGLLETAGIPHISPPLKTSTLCFDKELTKKVLQASGIPVPRGFEIHKTAYNTESLDERIRKELGYPVIIKTTSSGASRGVTLVQDKNDLSVATENAFHFSQDCIIEGYIKGREFSVGVTGHYLNPQALPVVEIISHNEFFDYEAKYVKGKAQELCPAEIDEILRGRLQDAAIKAYQAVKSEGHARIDIMYDGEKLYVLEINTFPGLMFASIFPKELIVHGISLSAFLDKEIREKLKK